MAPAPPLDAARVAVLIPVLARPERVQPLLASLFGSEARVHLRAVFLLSPGDIRETEAVATATVEHGGDRVASFAMVEPAGPGDYARKINRGVAQTDEEWVFLAADDLCFCPAWADAAVHAGTRSRRRVVGTNDLGNERVTRGEASTHTLVHRTYAEQGATFDRQPGVLLHEGYDHNFVDDELVLVARRRMEFVTASRSMVEHLHPHWGKARWDATYTRGQERFDDDRRLFGERSKAWRHRPLAR